MNENWKIKKSGKVLPRPTLWGKHEYTKLYYYTQTELAVYDERLWKSSEQHKQP